MIGKIFGKDEIGSAAGAAPDREIVHERAHQKKASSRSTKQVFLGERIRDVFQIETASLIKDMYDQLAAIQLDGELDFLLAILAISVIIGVDHAFAHGHADFVDIVLVEAGFFGCAHYEAFGHVDAFEPGVKRHVQTSGFRSHWSFKALNGAEYGYHRRRMASIWCAV